jgi:hypothetical protein
MVVGGRSLTFVLALDFTKDKSTQPAGILAAIIKQAVRVVAISTSPPTFLVETIKAFGHLHPRKFRQNTGMQGMLRTE